MSSINTNAGAMVALKTLKGINSALAKTQSEISTGKTVNSAKDNAAVWAISKVMEADVKGFQGIADSLAMGESSVAVAQKAAETVSGLLTNVKEKIVSAQEANVDREKIQTDIAALRDQIKSVIGTAQFNGLNLVSGTDDVKVLSSLDRASDGTVTASHITVARQDLSTEAGKLGTTAATTTSYGSITAPGGSALATGTTTAAAGKAAEVTFLATGLASGHVYSMNINGSTLSYTATGSEDATALANHFTGAINALGLEGIKATNAAGVLTLANANAFNSVALTTTSTTDGNLEVTHVNGSGAGNVPTDPDSVTIEQRAETIDFSTTAGVNAGDSYNVTVGSKSYAYIAGDGETMEDVAKGLKTAIDAGSDDKLSTQAQYNSTTGQWSLAIDDKTGGRTMSLTVTTGGTASGGLFGLDNLDVTTDAGAASALNNIETMIQTATDAASSFGSVAGRLETQSEFVSSLTASLQEGIGSLVDANMEEASARLQALQTQQQLGIQALSIANQQPQNILSLFK